MKNQHHNLRKSRGIYLLPNLLTVTALFSGFYAIIAAIKGDFDLACVAVFIAMIMDTLDGRIARLTQTQTAFGAELDSLSDIVSFGVAPALIAYLWGFESLGKAGWLVAFFFTTSVALRLARFNTQTATTDKRYFKGLPCPAAAWVVVSLIWSASQYGFDGTFITITAATLTVIASLCMVSNIPYYSFKDFHFKNKVSYLAILLIVLVFVLVAVDPPLVLLAIILGYAGYAPLFWLMRHARRLRLNRMQKKEKRKERQVK
jgi:CDP-diacylglycerol--serine O-phosphatidyltransferase